MSRPASKEATPRQREVLVWVKAFIREHGMPPTVREIGEAFGIKSSSVFELLKALEKKGYLRRGNLGARSLVVEDRSKHAQSGHAKVPIVGRIAAGKPIFAVEDRIGTVTVDKKLLRSREAYALRVEGNSMVEAGILDGDYVIVRKQETAEDGDIVVALLEDEATLKQFYREQDGIRLEPANSQMQTIRVQTSEFRIQGKVIGVQRLFDTP